MYEDLLLEAKTEEEAVKRLAKIISLLRSEEGCPWDKEQTHESLRSCLIEEAYEVVEAIDNKDWDNLEEELGDVLLQVIFHSDLGREEGKFDLKSIANRECDKMIRRHPHIFSNFKVDSIDTVVERWENMKQREAKISYTESMERIPKSLPALRKSYKVQEKAAQVGFDWDDVDSAFEKITEETKELIEAYKTRSQATIFEELGDLLFAVVNVARFLQVDPEDALNFASQKFIRRFSYIENSAKEEGRRLEDLTLTEMDKLWEDSKALD
ncbi:MAG: nucleoside triphosphate pyrophosphohydrolase [Clostridiales bacterium]|nr:nucleoside triphosphate pyrophosphohydrolase [Clostridiales bacterium]